MKTYNTVIIGGGASGILAAIYLNDKNSLLLEKNNTLGKKILITGGGRCNLTNNANFKEYIKKYFGTGNYYRPAFNTFFKQDIIKLLEDNGCKTKEEDNKRIFPESDKSKTVVDTLTTILNLKDTKYKLNCNVNSVSKNDEYFLIEYNNNQKIKSKNIIISTGGLSYPKTGSTGDGHKIATTLGHTKTKFMAGLSPIALKEKWIRPLQGTTIDVSIEIKNSDKSLIKDKGSIVFTQQGISGFVVLDNSMTIAQNLTKYNTLQLNMDLADHYNYEELDKKLQKDFEKQTNIGLKRYLHKYMPKRMTTHFLNYLNIPEDTILNQVTRKQRIHIRDALKRLEFTITNVLEKESMVTNSGIKHSEIDPNTLESKIVKNLYFTGEIIEGCGICGGFNLQKAFSTGVLAAQSINQKRG
jgi:predicted Rossmann fold flavoprotein